MSDFIILMVEDDAGHAGLLKIALERSGVSNEILHFEDGLRVLQYLNREGDGLKRSPRQAYVMLLDIRMPIMDGIEVLKRIKNDEALKAIPVVMVTTTDESNTIDLCYQLGCLDYIVKPVSFQVFRQIIEALAVSLRELEVPVIS